MTTRTMMAVAVLLAASAVPASALKLGESAPLATREMKDADGKAWSVEGVRGERGTLVMFICVHCPWVQAWNERIAELGKQAREAGIGVIAVNANDPSRSSQDGVDGMRAQSKANSFEFPYVVDEGSVLARAYDAQRTPEVYLFDASGSLVYEGTIDDNAHDAGAVEERFLASAITSVAAGEKPDPAATKALGCSIKLYPEES